MALKKRVFYFLLIVFVFDLAYSFVQHYLMPLDGDLAPITLPSSGYTKVMSDPFGLNVLLHNEVYPAPNRYFAHAAISGYFKTVPFLLQTFVSPAKSVYISCAIAKTAIQVVILIIISCYICCLNLKKENILICCLLLSPLFQASNENYRVMGIIDESIVYTFFYALPLTLLLIYFFPFYKAYITRQKLTLTSLQKMLLTGLSIVLSFNGALIPGIVVISFSMIVFSHALTIYRGTQNLAGATKGIDKALVFFSLFFVLMSLYSLFIGRNNLENFNTKLDTAQRFSRIPSGLHDIFLQHKGLTSVVLIILLNTIIIYRAGINRDNPWIKKLFLSLMLFGVIYIILLPFGGFRHYRPNILRNDTMIPITLVLFFMFGLTSYLILNSHLKHLKIYIAFLISVLIIFTLLDAPLQAKNWSERLAFKTIDESPLHAVPIKDSCTVLSWGIISDSLETTINVKMLKYWGIIKKEKLYYHQLGQRTKIEKGAFPH